MKGDKKIVVLFMCVVLLSTMVATSVSAAGPLDISTYDITKTTTGTKVVREAMQRWKAYGLQVDSNNVKAYEINPGEYLLAPASAKIELESVQQPDGSVKLEPRLITDLRNDSLSSSDSGTKDVSPMAAPYWDMVGSNY